MRIMVQKFGGTSVADRERQEQVLAKVKRGLDDGCKMLVVLSARAGETNRLLTSRTVSDEPSAAMGGAGAATI